MYNIFVIILIVILFILFIFSNSLDGFCNCNKKKYNIDNFNSIYYTNNLFNPIIPTPQSNYEKNISKINKQNKYKKNLSVAINSIPTIQCNELLDKNNCNNYGCNWFNDVCSSTYPIYY